MCMQIFIINLNFMIMKKEEYLAEIYALAQKAKLTTKEVDEFLTPRYKKDCLEKIYHLSCEAELSLDGVHSYLSEKMGDAELNADQEIVPGMFVYENDTFAKGIIPHRQIKGVVGCIRKRTAYVICLTANKLPWSSTNLQVKITKKMTDGREATREILKAAQENKGQAEAAQWCHNYAENGVKQGEAFLPSISEWKDICSNLSAVNRSLELLGAPELYNDAVWTSNEDYERCVWNVFIPGCHISSDYKRESNLVRPVLAIKL